MTVAHNSLATRFNVWQKYSWYGQPGNVKNVFGNLRNASENLLTPSDMVGLSWKILSLKCHASHSEKIGRLGKVGVT